MGLQWKARAAVILKHPYVVWTLGLVGAAVARLVRQTIDWRVVYLDPTLDPVHPRFAGRCVFAGWHEYLIMSIVLRADPRMLALASRHGDGEIIAQALVRLGWSVARGSTKRGGTEALMLMLRDDHRLPNLTTDGPRGPRRYFSLGAIFLASKLGLPLVCVGYGYHRPWRLRSWDRFAIPRPFSRCRAVFGPALRVPENVDRTMLERYRAYFERHLCWLTEEAERWAESGQHRDGEMPMIPGKACDAMLRGPDRPAYQWPDWLAQEWAELNASGQAAQDIAAPSAAPGERSPLSGSTA